jgi:hypothetical protein
MPFELPTPESAQRCVYPLLAGSLKRFCLFLPESDAFVCSRDAFVKWEWLLSFLQMWQQTLRSLLFFPLIVGLFSRRNLLLERNGQNRCRDVGYFCIVLYA